MVKDARCVDCLETEIFIVKVTNKQRLCGEGVWLDVNVCSCDRLQEARFADVRVTTDQQRPSIRIDTWQSTKMLPNLFKIDQRIS